MDRDESVRRIDKPVDAGLSSTFPDFGSVDYDLLTGLPNMSRFFILANSGVKTLSRDGKQPVILFFDLGGMKFYNVKYGFAAGDDLLRRFAKLLVSHFGKESIGRFGQDHFAVYTYGDSLEKRLNVIFDEWKAANATNPLIRVGIFAEGTLDSDVGYACDMAKIACDKMRNNYNSSFCYFDEEMRSEIDSRRYVIDNLDKALQEGWIKVYYQAIVRSVNGKVCDEEALARWIDPVKGFMSPAEFIPVLEDAGLIYKLDLYVVDRVIDKMKKMIAEGMHLVPQSINLSRSDFDSCDIVEEIRRRIDDSGMSRSKLTIEITESVVGKDFDFMKEQIERFRALGFTVWLDDFGSGYSSLDVLRKINVQLLKFDMKFMQELNDYDNGKIILTELMRMATALGLDTVCEGVETLEQVNFLREIGCSKMQGYYFAKPMSLEELFERFNKGIRIGFENPQEAQYFEALGKINLHDLSVIADADDKDEGKYFNSIPMAIVEVLGDKVRLVRSNQSYRDYVRSRYGVDMSSQGSNYAEMMYHPDSTLMNVINHCTEARPSAYFDEMLKDGSTVHAFAKRIGVNPKTGDVAIAVAVLTITESDQGASYANIARALAADYFNLFYVDLETEQYIEYTSGENNEDFAMERQGKNFFAESRRNAHVYLHHDDVEDFLQAFTKENVLQELKEHGTFSLTYRQLVNGVRTYVNMKVMRMIKDGRYIIIGVSNVDAQVKKKELMNRVKEERLAYSRISALAGNYLCLYTVDPVTDHYIEYRGTSALEGFGQTVEGDNFFEVVRDHTLSMVHKPDQALFKEIFNKENILDEISRYGVFEYASRFIIGGNPVPVRIRAVITKEGDDKKLIFGFSRADMT